MSTPRVRRILLASVSLWALALFIGVAAGPLGAQQPRQRGEDMSQYLPPGAGKALVARECSTCHDLDGVVRLRASKDAWEQVVLDMVARGAPLMIEEADEIVLYLGDVFGPKAPPLVDVNAAGLEELTRIPGITAALAERLITHRKEHGPFASREDVRAALGLAPATFEKVKWYLRAAPGAATPAQPRRTP